MYFFRVGKWLKTPVKWLILNQIAIHNPEVTGSTPVFATFLNPKLLKINSLGFFVPDKFPSSSKTYDLIATKTSIN